MRYVLGTILSGYLVAFALILWRDRGRGFRDMTRTVCACATVGIIAGYMWRGLLL